MKFPAGLEPERRYIIDVVVGEFLGLEYRAEVHGGPSFTLSIDQDPSGRRVVLPDCFFPLASRFWMQAESMPERPLRQARVLDIQLPALYGESNAEGWLVCAADGAHLGIDVFGSAFFMLSRYEELVKSERDECDRFPAAASIALQEGFLESPIVDVYVDLLRCVLEQIWPSLTFRQRSARVLLSHDVDEISLHGRSVASVIRTIGADVVLRRDLLLAGRRLAAYAQILRKNSPVDRDPFNTFQFIMETSERHGLKSAFYFVSQVTHPGRDPRYSLDTGWVRKLLRDIHARGHEIGLHTSYETYVRPEQTKAEFDALVHACEEEGIRQDEWGGRQHYLRWKNPQTWDNWEFSGLQYDSTLGFAQHAGFRCGSCREFPVWSFASRRRLQLRERPLIAMEGTLLSYMGMSSDAAFEKLQRLAAMCKRHHGDFTLLWHNNLLVDKTLRRTFVSIVEVAASQAS